MSSSARFARIRFYRPNGELLEKRVSPGDALFGILAGWRLFEPLARSSYSAEPLETAACRSLDSESAINIHDEETERPSGAPPYLPSRIQRRKNVEIRNRVAVDRSRPISACSANRHDEHRHVAAGIEKLGRPLHARPDHSVHSSRDVVVIGTQHARIVGSTSPVFDLQAGAPRVPISPSINPALLRPPDNGDGARADWGGFLARRPFRWGRTLGK